MSPRAIQAELDATYAEHLQHEADEQTERERRAIVVSEIGALLLVGMMMGVAILGLLR